MSKSARSEAVSGRLLTREEVVNLELTDATACLSVELVTDLVKPLSLEVPAVTICGLGRAVSCFLGVEVSCDDGLTASVEFGADLGEAACGGLSGDGARDDLGASACVDCGLGGGTVCGLGEALGRGGLAASTVADCDLEADSDIRAAPADTDCGLGDAISCDVLAGPVDAACGLGDATVCGVLAAGADVGCSLGDAIGCGVLATGVDVGCGLGDATGSDILIAEVDAGGGLGDETGFDILAAPADLGSGLAGATDCGGFSAGIFLVESAGSISLRFLFGTDSDRSTSSFLRLRFSLSSFKTVMAFWFSLLNLLLSQA